MESPPGFNLDLAVTQWRDELARQPGLTPADLRELEAHLRDGFAELRKNPIREEEAFLLARLRLGSPQPVATEFAKASPKRLWAPRLFWLVFGVFVFQIWQPTIDVLVADLYLELGFPPGLWQIVIFGLGDALIYVAPLLLVGWWLAYGVPQFVVRLLSTRNRVAAVGSCIYFCPIAFRVIIMVLRANSQFRQPGIMDPIFNSADQFGLGEHSDFAVLLNCIWPLCLLALMVWLTPGRAKIKTRTVTA